MSVSIETSFFTTLPLPVFAYLSESTQRALGEYLRNGKQTRRAYLLGEFFKSLDWLPLAEIPNPFEGKLSWEVERKLFQEIEAYLAEKGSRREKSRKQRKDHQLKVFEYYRTQVSSQDKALLESLRDYELDRTGRDANWQHYFSFKSFKKIDEFTQASSSLRQAWIQQFKEDVATYQRNREKLRQAASCLDAQTGFFDFDDWCDWVEEDPTFGKEKKVSNPSSATSLSPVQAAFSLFQLSSSAEVSREELKRRFRELTLKHHPDVPGGSNEAMKQLLAAYDCLRTVFKS